MISAVATAENAGGSQSAHQGCRGRPGISASTTAARGTGGAG